MVYFTITPKSMVFHYRIIVFGGVSINRSLMQYPLKRRKPYDVLVLCCRTNQPCHSATSPNSYRNGVEVNGPFRKYILAAFNRQCIGPPSGNQ